jgi:hypothetical protein
VAGAAALLPVLAATGCGTGADARQAQTATEALYRAARAHDGATACAQLSPPLRKQLVADEGGPCAKAVLELALHGSRAGSVRVFATSAEVQLRGGDTVFLSATKLGWRVDAVGCRPQGQEPADCEAES